MTIAGMEGKWRRSLREREIVGLVGEALKLLTTGIPFFSFIPICLWTKSF